MTKHNPPFLILKPRPGSRAAQVIAKDSGVVGVPFVDSHIRESEPGQPDRRETQKYVVSYEGNLYGAENLKEYGQRVIHAAMRLAEGYPTVARGVFPQDQFDVWGVVERIPYTSKSGRTEHCWKAVMSKEGV